MMKILAITVLTTGFGLVGASTLMADHGNFSGEQVKQLVAGATAKSTSDSGTEFESRYAEDGTVTIEGSNGFSDTGKWTIEGDNFCGVMQKIRNGKKACWTIRHMNGDKYLYKGIDGARTLTNRIAK